MSSPYHVVLLFEHGQGLVIYVHSTPLDRFVDAIRVGLRTARSRWHDPSYLAMCLLRTLNVYYPPPSFDPTAGIGVHPTGIEGNSVSPPSIFVDTVHRRVGFGPADRSYEPREPGKPPVFVLPEAYVTFEEFVAQPLSGDASSTRRRKRPRSGAGSGR